MNLSHAHAEILKLNVPVFRTADVCTKLRVSTTSASKILRRLAQYGFFHQITRGCWALAEINDPFVLAEQLTSPLPAYISLHSALHFHGMISQIPRVIYAVSLGKTLRRSTPLGEFSVHHLAPCFFFGFETYGKFATKIATPEKALLDVLYLRQNQPHLFRALPELEFPENFSFAGCNKIVRKIRSARRSTFVKQCLSEIIAANDGNERRQRHSP